MKVQRIEYIGRRPTERLHRGQRVRTLRDRYQVRRGEEVEVAGFYADGVGVEVEVWDRPDPMMEAMYGPAIRRMAPFARRRAARFMQWELEA